MATTKERTWRPHLFGLTIGGLTALLITVCYQRGWFDPYEWKTRDLLQRYAHARAAEHKDIELLAIDEETIARLRDQCTWPWPRQIHSLVVDYLRLARARAVVFDVLFVDRAPSMVSPESLRPIRKRLAELREAVSSGRLSTERCAQELRAVEASVAELDQRNDEVLAESMRAAGDVFLAFVFDQAAIAPAAPAATRLSCLPGEGLSVKSGALEARNMRPLLPAPVLLDAMRGGGHINFFPDPDGVCRSVRLFLESEGRLYPSLPMSVALARLGAEPGRIRAARGGELRYDRARRVVTAPMDARGRMLLNYCNTFRLTPYYLVLASALQLREGKRPAIPLRRFQGKTVIIAASAKGLFDLRATPVDAQQLGGVVHAQALANLLDGSFLRRTPAGLTVVVIVAGALLVGIALHRLGPALGAALAVLMILGYWALAAQAFLRYATVFDVVAPTAGMALSLVAVLTHSFAYAERQRRIERELMAQELGIAREIQRSLMPSSPPTAPGVDLAGWSGPCEDTGGDFYDFIPLADGRLILAVGDVSGHGLGPALLTASTHSYLHATAPSDGDPHAMIAAINDLLCDDITGDRFVTMFLGVYDPAARVLCYASAGHEPPVILRRDGRVEQLDSTGPPLGWMHGVDYDEAPPVRFAPGDLLVVLTDGVTEAMNRRRDLFGRERLVERLRGAADRPAEDIINDVRAAVEEFRGRIPQQDDVTLIAMRVIEEDEDALEEIVFAGEEE